MNGKVMLLAGLLAAGAGLTACESGQKSSQAGAMKKSLYERLGGEKAIAAVVDDFVARTAPNPKVNFTRKGVPGFNEWNASPENVARLKRLLVEFIAQAAGGPQKYSGRSMKESHRGMRITTAEFNAMAGDLSASLDKLGVKDPEKAELMAAVGGTAKDIIEIP